MLLFFSRQRRIAQSPTNLVHLLPKRLPPRAPDDEIRGLIVRLFRCADVEFEKRVRDGLVEGHVQGLERLYDDSIFVVFKPRRQKGKRRTDHDDLGVSYHGVCQREGQDDPDLQWGDVAVRGDVVHRVQQPEIAIRRFGRIAAS